MDAEWGEIAGLAKVGHFAAEQHLGVDLLDVANAGHVAADTPKTGGPALFERSEEGSGREAPELWHGMLKLGGGVGSE
jgi:hypothetical protein